MAAPGRVAHHHRHRSVERRWRAGQRVAQAGTERRAFRRRDRESREIAAHGSFSARLHDREDLDAPEMRPQVMTHQVLDVASLAAVLADRLPPGCEHEIHRSGGRIEEPHPAIGEPHLQAQLGAEQRVHRADDEAHDDRRRPVDAEPPADLWRHLGVSPASHGVETGLRRTARARPDTRGAATYGA
jgi:hypothetical protein